LNVSQIGFSTLSTTTTPTSKLSWPPLENLIVFYMSMACSSCRQELAQQLEERVPQMIAAAEQLACEIPRQCMH
jgi:hypothetical protein